jgi:hypothetical protein
MGRIFRRRCHEFRLFMNIKVPFVTSGGELSGYQRQWR